MQRVAMQLVATSAQVSGTYGGFVIADFEARAAELLGPGAYGYFAGGAGDESRCATTSRPGSGSRCSPGCWSASASATPRSRCSAAPSAPGPGRADGLPAGAHADAELGDGPGRRGDRIDLGPVVADHDRSAPTSPRRWAVPIGGCSSTSSRTAASPTTSCALRGTAATRRSSSRSTSPTGAARARPALGLRRRAPDVRPPRQRSDDAGRAPRDARSEPDVGRHRRLRRGERAAGRAEGHPATRTTPSEPSTRGSRGSSCPTTAAASSTPSCRGADALGPIVDAVAGRSTCWSTVASGAAGTSPRRSRSVPTRSWSADPCCGGWRARARPALGRCSSSSSPSSTPALACWAAREPRPRPLVRHCRPF